MSDPIRPVGLLAGSGRFPIVFAEKARQLGIPVVCVGIRNEASPELAELVSRFYWAGVARMGRMIGCFRRENVRHVVMAGKIQKTRMFAPLRLLRLWPDWRTLRFWFRRRRRDNYA
jgi:UDP-2,3-diacylglucosamine hydrolase